MSFSIHQAIARNNTSIQLSSYSILSVILFFTLMLYLIILRPQIKRTKEHKKMMASLIQGDEILTTSGIVGQISKINDNYIVIALNSTTEIIINRDFVSAILPKGTMKALNIMI
ncbi:MAG: preprotein translocase subunit YajC [Candidatus Dasytiphilus stammeri]